jgi:ATP-dependent DNA helicase RecG
MTFSAGSVASQTEGGVLHLGRNDKGLVVALKDASKLLEDIPNKVRDALGILVNLKLHEENGQAWLEILVDTYPNPISYRGHYYQRSGSTNQELKGVALDRFLLRRHGRTWDGVPMPGVKISDLSTTAIQQFRDLARTSGRLDPADLRLSKAALVEKLQLTDGTYLKRAAVLLFHKDPERFITGTFVKVGFFRSESDLAYHDMIQGDLFTQAAKTIDLVRTKYLKAAITYQGIQRIERYPVADAALREAALNALVHRDYANGASVQIRVYDDNLKIWKTCAYPDSWTVKTLLGVHASTPLNPAIAHVFFRSGEIETCGRGIERILAACKDAGTPKPKLTFDGTGIALEFRYPPEYLKAMADPGRATRQVTGQVDEELRRILIIIRKEMSRQEIQAALALRGRENFEARYLKPALEAACIERTISEKPNSRLQKYRLTEKSRALLETLHQTS